MTLSDAPIVRPDRRSRRGSCGTASWRDGAVALSHRTVAGDRAARDSGHTDPEAIIDYTTISYDVADSIATITLDRPDALNALDAAMERELVYVWDRVDDDDNVRAVVVTGRGRAFC